MATIRKFAGSIRGIAAPEMDTETKVNHSITINIEDIIIDTDYNTITASLGAEIEYLQLNGETISTVKQPITISVIG